MDKVNLIMNQAFCIMKVNFLKEKNMVYLKNMEKMEILNMKETIETILKVEKALNIMKMEIQHLKVILKEDKETEMEKFMMKTDNL